MTVQKPIELVWGCDYRSYAAGFIAEVPPPLQPASAALPRTYFLIHKPPQGGNEEVRKRFEEKAALGEAKLTYKAQAFQLSPDGFPRPFVRARWMVDQRLALLMTLWLRAGPIVTSEPVNENGTRVLRLSAKSLKEEEVDLNRLDTVLNVVFDRPGGCGDVLMYFQGHEGYDIHLFRYTDAGLVAPKISHGDGC